jgi:hypothetical protein
MEMREGKVWARNKKSWSEILWNEEIRRCGVVDIAEKVGEAEMVWARNKER